MEKQTTIRNGFIKPIILEDNYITQNFVSPHLCLDLIKLGLPAKNVFKWIIKGNKVKLETRAFDLRNNYLDTVKGYKRNKPDCVVNAYTVMDMIKFSPEFCLATINKNYRVGGLLMNTCDLVEHSRFPDLFAEYLKILLIKGVLVIK